MQEKRGLLICLEGLDRSGKSTQSKKLIERLNADGQPSELFIFPDRSTKTGQIIDKYLKNKDFVLSDEEIHKLFSENRWESIGNIKSKLLSGKNVILDRYAYSGVVFTAAKSFDAGLIQPDITFYLEIDEKTLQSRKDFGLERYENKEFQLKVKEKYELLQKSCAFTIIDACQSVESVFCAILEKLSGFSLKTQAFTYLWEDQESVFKQQYFNQQ